MNKTVNPTAKQIFETSKTIAVVGLSQNRLKDSRMVAEYLQSAGFTIIPVHPTADELMGLKVYQSILDIPFTVDIVDIFLNEKRVPPVLEEAIQLKPKAIWLQFGTGFHPEFEKRAEESGIAFYQDRCIKIDHLHQ